MKDSYEEGVKGAGMCNVNSKYNEKGHLFLYIYTYVYPEHLQLI